MSSPRKRCGATAALLFVSETLAAGEARYFGLDVPRGIPARFEPAMFAPFAGRARLSINSPAFSPDFRRFVFIVEDSSNPARVAVTVYEARRRGDGPSEHWSPPAPMPMLTRGGYTAGEAGFSRDGRWLFYSSSRPPGAQGLEPRIFRAAVLAEGFGAPEFIGIEPPHGGGTFYPRLLAHGDLAFTAPGSADRDDLETAPQLAPDDGVLFFLRHVDGANRLHWVELTSVLEESP